MSHVRFANASTGYLYGPALIMTGNGGRTWQVQPGLQVEALAIVGGTVYRVAYDHGGCPGPCQPTLQEAAVGSSAWRTLMNPIVAPGESGSAQLVASGAALLLGVYGNLAGDRLEAQAVIYRSVDGGRSWQREADPCAGTGGSGLGEDEHLIDLASAAGGFFAGLCDARDGDRSVVVTSADAGGSWSATVAVPPLPSHQLAVATPTTLAVVAGTGGGSGPPAADLLLSFDAGRHWTTAATDTVQPSQLEPVTWVGFHTPDAGSWVSGPHTIWTTEDGGRTWSKTAFR